MEVSTDTKEDLMDWIEKIRECTSTAQTRVCSGYCGGVIGVVGCNGGSGCCGV